MKRFVPVLILSLVFAVPALAGDELAEVVPPQLPGGLAAPQKVLCAGEPIDVDIGHAAPCFVDFDGDGLRDLLVGQFGDGKLRIYKNVGDRSAPKFEDFTLFQAGPGDGKVPSG
ncbi:MAG: FG-GAP repeat domain-containing protein [Planctomycetota bacterium]